MCLYLLVTLYSQNKNSQLHMSVVTADVVAAGCLQRILLQSFLPCVARVPSAGVRESALCARSSDMRLGDGRDIETLGWAKLHRATEADNTIGHTHN